MKVYTVFFLVKNLTPLLLKNPNLSSPPYLSFRKASENSGESPDIYSLDGNKTLRYDNYNLIFVENLRRVYESRRDNG